MTCNQDQHSTVHTVNCTTNSAEPCILDYLSCNFIVLLYFQMACVNHVYSRACCRNLIVVVAIGLTLLVLSTLASLLEKDTKEGKAQEGGGQGGLTLCQFYVLVHLPQIMMMVFLPQISFNNPLSVSAASVLGKYQQIQLISVFSGISFKCLSNKTGFFILSNLE